MPIVGKSLLQAAYERLDEFALLLHFGLAWVVSRLALPSGVLAVASPGLALGISPAVDLG